jgi:hypothetical protein
MKVQHRRVRPDQAIRQGLRSKIHGGRGIRGCPKVCSIRHLAYVATAFQSIAAEPLKVRAVRITYEAAVLRHFTAEFALLDPPQRQARKTG